MVCGKLYVTRPMQTKLTLRMDDRLIVRAKRHAASVDKSLSQMVAEYFLAVLPTDQPPVEQTPTVSRLRGCLKDAVADRDDYRQYLADKYL